MIYFGDAKQPTAHITIYHFRRILNNNQILFRYETIEMQKTKWMDPENAIMALCKFRRAMDGSIVETIFRPFHSFYAFSVWWAVWRTVCFYWIFIEFLTIFFGFSSNIFLGYQFSVLIVFRSDLSCQISSWGCWETLSCISRLYFPLIHLISSHFVSTPAYYPAVSPLCIVSIDFFSRWFFHSFSAAVLSTFRE